MLGELRGAHVLLLQGPMGPFFAHLAQQLRAAGSNVTKINFNGGDSYYFREEDAVSYTGTAEAWPAFVREFLDVRSVSHLVLFGDLRNYHYLAVAEARALGIEVYVFEEGYLRPDCVTLERGGVNARSTLFRDSAFYRQFAKDSIVRPNPVGHVFWYAAFIAAAYAWAMYLRRYRFPHYRHHRDLHPIREGMRWIVAGTSRKLLWKIRDRSVTKRFSGPLSGRYFLVPLQVHNDFQVRGSECKSVEAFITEVAQSFSMHAPHDHHLVIKHHPLDRAYRDYTQLLDDLREQLGLEGRIHYVADPHLPTLLRYARGTIVLNSTVGLSSLQHGTPVIGLGTSFYSLAGLSYRGDLAGFLQDPGEVDRELVSGFCNFLANHNQLPGSFYKRRFLPNVVVDSGNADMVVPLVDGVCAGVQGRSGPP